MNSDVDRFFAFYKTSSLWTGSLGGIRQFQLSSLKFDRPELSNDLMELPQIPVGTVLGKRAEYYFKFCIDNCRNYDLIGANIQIYRDKVTLGEIDFIIKNNNSNKVLHVELVYKFYIYSPQRFAVSSHLTDSQNLELSRYIGPNGRDSLIRKFDHLKNHQLPIIYRPEAIDQLKKMGVDSTTLEQQVCFLAHIYIPRHMWDHRYHYINKRCIKGYYLEEHAFAKAITSNKYYLPEKKQWKMQPAALQEEYSHSIILTLVNKSLQRGFSPLLWMRLPDRSFESFFVINNHL